MSEETKLKRTLVGEVVSNRMDKTIAVLIERRVEHPLYRKYVRKSTKLLAHDENNECNPGDKVAIEECRPISKRKAWKLQRVIERAAQV
ncbi:MAG: 30S ribosomal protein S17 [Gammaproteobacteria bacterium]|nr:30S ribosomal protein S17 [Gammaproteobacteria bacterium]MBI5617743.1 30S ribosomal protein S17 [Gammaproteobacteria bacterium]